MEATSKLLTLTSSGFNFEVAPLLIGVQMKKINLSRGLMALVDDEDYDYLMQWKWAADTRGYAVRSEKRSETGKKLRRLIRMNRIILERKLNRPLTADEIADHKNHKVADNQRKNIRLATHSDNMRNRLMATRTKSGYKGVWLNQKTGKWIAYLKYKGQMMTIKRCDTKEEAARAYNDMAEELFGEFAYLNKIPPEENPHESAD